MLKGNSGLLRIGQCFFVVWSSSLTQWQRSLSEVKPTVSNLINPALIYIPDFPDY